MSLEATEALRRPLGRAPAHTEPLKCPPPLEARHHAEILIDGDRISVPFAERCHGARHVVFDGRRVQLTDEIRDCVRIDRDDGRRLVLESD